MHLKIERSGVRSELAEQLRAQYRNPASCGLSVPSRPRPGRWPLAQLLPVPISNRCGAMRARAWLRLREAATAPASGERTPAAEKVHEAEDDLSR